MFCLKAIFLSFTILKQKIEGQDLKDERGRQLAVRYNEECLNVNAKNDLIINKTSAEWREC